MKRDAPTLDTLPASLFVMQAAPGSTPVFASRKARNVIRTARIRGLVTTLVILPAIPPSAIMTVETAILLPGPVTQRTTPLTTDAIVDAGCSIPIVKAPTLLAATITIAHPTTRSPI